MTAGFRIRLLLVVAAAAFVAGCGSKISESNYYRVHYGMTEDEVDDVLGPAHQVSELTAATSPSSTRPSLRKIKSWSRGSIVIRVEFEEGHVVRRSADGVTGESPTSKAA